MMCGLPSMRVCAPVTLSKATDTPRHKGLGIRQTAERLSENSQTLGEGIVDYKSATTWALSRFTPLTPVAVGRSVHNGATYVRR
jgi:hypothetical protein